MPTMEMFPELIQWKLIHQSQNQINVVFFDPYMHKMLFDKLDFEIIDGVVNYVVIDDPIPSEENVNG